jgi:hypothetical protein
MKEQADNITRPAHYMTDGGIETIDYIKSALSADGFVDYCIGNVIKYVSRHRKKGGIEDLKKAQVYLNWSISRGLESERIEIDGKINKQK